MLLEETMKILKGLLEKTDVTCIEIRDALNLVHVEYDEETLEEKEDQEYPSEYDLVLKADLCHCDIQTIDGLLSDYSNVEMRLRDGHLEIFETFVKEKMEA